MEKTTSDPPTSTSTATVTTIAMVPLNPRSSAHENNGAASAASITPRSNGARSPEAQLVRNTSSPTATAVSRIRPRVVAPLSDCDWSEESDSGAPSAASVDAWSTLAIPPCRSPASPCCRGGGRRNKQNYLSGGRQFRERLQTQPNRGGRAVTSPEMSDSPVDSCVTTVAATQQDQFTQSGGFHTSRAGVR